MPNESTVLAEGKTKVVRSIADGDQPDDWPQLVELESKDDITAGDGAKRDLIEGKAEAATTTTCNVFELLKQAGIPVHYISRKSERVFVAYEADMIPLELVIRRIATGSYLKRNPSAEEGELFGEPIFEFFHKDDDNHDPLLKFDFEQGVALRYAADQPEGVEPFDSIELDTLKLYENRSQSLGELERITHQVFAVLEEAWAAQDVQLVDMKIECGWVLMDGEWTIVVADVIDNDSWRIWPAGDKSQQKDKQVYRELAESDDPKATAKELGKIKKNYQWVAEATSQFVP